MKLVNDWIADILKALFHTSALFTVASIAVNGTFLVDNWYRSSGNTGDYSADS